MYLKNWQRARKLAVCCLRHPRDIPRYLRYHKWRGKMPVEAGLPWWSFGAIDFVKTRLGRNVRVFEFGSGGSTIFFAESCHSVECVENDPVWLKIVGERIKAIGANNVSIRTAALEFTRAEEILQSAFLGALNAPYDIIVVDSQDFGGLGAGALVRPACFERAERHVNPGGLIIVDDSWRFTEFRTANRAREVHVFEGFGPCRLGVTSTDVFVY